MRDLKYIICYNLILVAAIATTIYLLMLGWYSLPTLDDYGFIASAEDGIFQFVFDFYMNWQPRFSTFFVNSLIYVVFGRCTNLIPLTIIMLLLGYGGMYLLLRDAIHVTDYKLNIPISILATNLGILAYLEPSTFYWLSALNYTLAIWATLYLCEFLFFSSRPLWMRYLVVIICSLYISGTAENYTPLVIVVLGIIWCYKCYKQCSIKFWITQDVLLLSISLITISIGCIAMLLGPGNAVRLESLGKSGDLLGSFSFVPFIKTTAKASAIVIARLVSRAPYYLILVAICLWGGKVMKVSGYEYTKPITWREALISLIYLIGFIVLAVAACVFGFGWYPSLRGLCFLSFAILFTCIYVFFKYGNKCYDRWNIIEINLIIWMIICLFGISYLFAVDQPRARLAHGEITERHAMIQQRVKEGNKDPLIISQVTNINTDRNSYTIFRTIVYKAFGKEYNHFQPRIIYMPYGLSTNPNDFRNYGIRKYYHADFDIIGWEVNDN